MALVPRSGGRKALPSLPVPQATLLTGDCARAPSLSSPSFPQEDQPSITLLQPWTRCCVTLDSQADWPCVGHTHTHTHTCCYIQPWPLAQPQQALSPEEAPKV